MRACTRHGLPHPALMRFVLKLLANLTDPHDGDVSDRVINVLTRLTPAVVRHTSAVGTGQSSSD